MLTHSMNNRLVKSALMVWASLACGHCGDPPVEHYENCTSAVTWLGELDTEISKLIIDGCVNSLCSSRSVSVVRAGKCRTNIEWKGDIASSLCAEASSSGVSISYYLDLSAHVNELTNGDQGTLRILDEEQGDVLFQSTTSLNYVGSTDGEVRCRTDTVYFGHRRGGDAGN